ncbi:MAG: hypothetical protein HPY44_08655 [Armatimonadetes bacterium]|nr:hypothetical protein [Armatimonadota bacterium]
MPRYEYHVVAKADRAPITMLNERLEAMALEGWEPILMSGENAVNILMRRPTQEAAAQQARPPQAAQPAQQQAPRPQAPAQPGATAPRPPQAGGQQ